MSNSNTHENTTNQVTPNATNHSNESTTQHLQRDDITIPKCAICGQELRDGYLVKENTPYGSAGRPFVARENEAGRPVVGERYGRWRDGVGQECENDRASLD